jgi:FtsP/CotA-like multicopper oxidase with cupredoxin domain
VASHPASTAAYRHGDPDSGAGLKVLALFLGLAVAIMAVIGLVLLSATLGARKDAQLAAKRAATVPTTAASHEMSGTAAATAAGAVATASFAGVAPANADTLAEKHLADPAELPAAPAGPVARVSLSINHTVVQIAPGVKYQTWTFGKTAPGPAIHVRQGQLVKVTMTNNSPMPHSIDFHAARIAPNVAFADIAPGKSFSFEFRANDPGVFMYRCGTKPVLAHIANGMYVSHSFASVNMGQVGLLRVGHVHGTMSH